MAALLTLLPTGAASAEPAPAAPSTLSVLSTLSAPPAPPASAVPQPEPVVDPAALTALAAAAAAAADASQQRLLEDYPAVRDDSEAAEPPVTSQSSRGELALSWAMDQIGKPYVWGAQGPDAFDCSGLSSQAWHAAGVDIPRTSQEQWRALPRVTDGSLRPGDLVVFYGNASHVGLYAGDGLVVQAPRPGRKVALTRMSAMPVLGVVRPG